MQITAIDLCELPEGRIRSPYLAVADINNNVRILSLDPSNLMERLSVQVSVGRFILRAQFPFTLLLFQALKGDISSLCMAYLRERGADTPPSLYLFVGQKDGVLQRTQVDEVTAKLSDMRMRWVSSQNIYLS